MTIRQKTISIILIITVIIISCGAGLSMTDNLAHVSGESMMPALHDGDIVYGSTSHDDIGRNDIIVSMMMTDGQAMMNISLNG